MDHLLANGDRERLLKLDGHVVNCGHCSHRSALLFDAWAETVRFETVPDEVLKASVLDQIEAEDLLVPKMVSHPAVVVGEPEAGSDGSMEFAVQAESATRPALTVVGGDAGSGGAGGRSGRRRLSRGRLLLGAAASLTMVAGAIGLGTQVGGNEAYETSGAFTDASGEPIDLMWDAADGSVRVTGSAMGDTPDDRVHQLWSLEDTGAVSIGILEPGTDGILDVTFRLDGELRDGDPLAVTLEPAGGSLEPSSPVLFEGDA